MLPGFKYRWNRTGGTLLHVSQRVPLVRPQPWSVNANVNVNLNVNSIVNLNVHVILSLPLPIPIPPGPWEVILKYTQGPGDNFS